jgi:phenylacetate-coenzyme A ligase PaaK-like adenylate-forming protein
MDHIFFIKNHKVFVKQALKMFRFQHEYCPVYRQYCDLLKIAVTQIKTLEAIPFLPIQFFKTQKIVSNNDAIQKVFESSGTTGQETSKHYVTDLDIYEQSFRIGFSKFYGHIENYALLALLPSYLERENSSLVYMAEHLIKDSQHEDSGFYLNNHAELIDKLKKLNDEDQSVLLIGVSYALLDLIDYAKAQNIALEKLGQNIIIMETGGMKGRRQELVKEQLHAVLKAGFGTNAIHSEYGMTELLSQAYSFNDGLFECPPWMHVLIRDNTSPLSYLPNGRPGGINIIDLANVNSCAFIATEDLGKKVNNDQFQVLGRFTEADIRGCNLLVAE